MKKAIFIFSMALACYTPAVAQLPASPETELLSTTPVEQDAAWAVSWWMKRHEKKLRDKESMESIDLLWIGDSITHNWENAGKQVWKENYQDLNAFNLGFSGDRTEHVLWRIDHGAMDDLSPKVVVVMIGTNNTGHRKEPADTTAKGIAAIIERIQQKSPESKILLLSVFPRDEKPSGELRKINRAINEIISTYDDKFESVEYLDIQDAFLDERGVLPKDIMPDGLHPNEKGYRIWADAMREKLIELMTVPE